MMQVWKYPLPQHDEEFSVEMPEGAEVLTVRLQGGNPMLWARVKPSAPLTRRRFRWTGTGHPIDPNAGKYIGTLMLAGGRLVFHIFEVIK